MLKELREANIERSKYWGGSDKITASFHALELGGEIGELLNVIKKIERHLLGIAGNKQTIEELRQMAYEEIGDVVIATDLLANKLGIDLEAAVRDKFNSKSREMDIQVFLPEKTFSWDEVDHVNFPVIAFNNKKED